MIFLLYGLDCRTPTEAESWQPRVYKHYKRQLPTSFKIGSWVLVLFPRELIGKNRKLSRPWHRPYRVTSVEDPDISVPKVYFPQDGNIQVHQSHVKVCLTNFPSGLYWYGGRRCGPGRPPRWVKELMESSEDVAPQPPPAAKTETGAEESIAPGSEPELTAEQLEQGCEPQLM